jgi:hypothetical protein
MKPNVEALQVFYGSIPVIATILIALWSNNRRIDDLRDSFSKLLKSEIDGLREFIRSEIRRLEDRIERLEHPIVRAK